MQNKPLIIFVFLIMFSSMAYQWYKNEASSNQELKKQAILKDLKDQGVPILSPKEFSDRLQTHSDPKLQKDRAMSMAQSVERMAVTKTLKGAKAEADTFKMTSMILKPSGVTCYTYKVKNRSGLTQSSRAALSEDGQLFVEGWNDGAMIQLWDKECLTPKGFELVANE
jgi:hypothetical protein